jgi:enamine deaminase RidA (YjgF/YER057c/UK114 family)
MQPIYINPLNQTPSPYYTHAISIRGGKTIYISGQTAYNEKYEYPGGDFASQVDQSLKNLLAVLTAANAKPENVVSIHLYVKDYQQEKHLQPLMSRLTKFFNPEKLPTSTLLGVQSLSRDVLLFEIEAIAFIPDS